MIISYLIDVTVLPINWAIAQEPNNIAAPIKVYIRVSLALVNFSELPRAKTKRKPE